MRSSCFSVLVYGAHGQVLLPFLRGWFLAFKASPEASASSFLFSFLLVCTAMHFTSQRSFGLCPMHLLSLLPPSASIHHMCFPPVLEESCLTHVQSQLFHLFSVSSSLLRGLASSSLSSFMSPACSCHVSIKYIQPFST